MRFNPLEAVGLHLMLGAIVLQFLVRAIARRQDP
jgi:hypothetical protein